MDLQQYRKELQEELDKILLYWMQYAIDEEQGGFIGRIDNDNIRYADAAKGSVLNARILWTFSAANSVLKDEKYLAVADRAFEYIRNYFVDKKFGGVFWSVDSKGNPLDTKKQIYAIAFAIYACAEYYRISLKEPAKQLAIQLYEEIQHYSFDEKKGGYFEAFARDWRSLDDLRLSDKDANEKKTMNTHLHILEAYANLYRIWPDGGLAHHIALLLHNFDEHFINKHTWHLNMFLDEDWHVKSDTISYGHDIEAAWLLLEAAEVIGNEELISAMKINAIKMSDAVREGLDADGGLWYEFEPSHGGLVKEKHWWPQAEALVGFFNAWQLTGNGTYLQAVFNNWTFIKKYILDSTSGEWFWGIDEHHAVMQGEDKAGLWKCPYHNSRACLETLHRMQGTLIDRQNQPA